MDALIFNPLEEFEKKFKDLHSDNTKKFFEELVKKSGVSPDENRETVKKYDEYVSNLEKMRKKMKWLKFFRIVMFITILLIPFVFWKMNPKIKALKEDIEQADMKAQQLLEQAKKQMQPLNALFSDRDALNLIMQTMPNIKFEDCFTVDQEADMKVNYDLVDELGNEQSTLDVIAGYYNENPFLFENRLIHEMGTETYHGYKTITWTETYRDSNGKMQTRTRSQTLHATVTKPKPFYKTQVVLKYGAQGGPELSFTRDATHLERLSEREVERYVKKGEKRLKKKTDKAIKGNGDFMSMSNTDFEVLFDALDRTNEVQFRTLFTPLAQTNMVDLLLSKTSYGDDFNFIKRNRMNTIVSNHSQNRAINLYPNDYVSYSFDMICNNFTNKNAEYFKAVYFDFAPLLSIPMYQERPVQSLKPIPDNAQLYSFKECEALANAVNRKHVVHPSTKTSAILKSEFVRSSNKTDENRVTAYSYDIAQRVEYISMLGGDGRFHSVPVHWDDYLPLVHQTSLFVSDIETGKSMKPFATRNGLCIYKK